MTFQMFRPIWLVLLGTGVIATLLMSPATRWLVREQAIADGLTLTSTTAQVRHGENARRLYSAAHSHDLQIQLAAADEADDPVAHVAALRALVRLFPDSPAVYAALLRSEVRDDPESKTGVYVDRPNQDYYLSGEAPPRGDKAIPPNAASLAAFDADAAAGEHLDPDNAFFPLMHAAGLFAGHQDAQAQGAVLRAGRATAWREYLSDDIIGRIRLASTAEGGHATALSRLAIAASISFPQYAPVRAVARIATSEAARSEEATGRPEQGMAIRHALLRCGSLMRAHSTTGIGSLVGAAIAAIAIERPNGAVLPTIGPHFSGTQRVALRLRTFVAYANDAGDGKDAQQAQDEDAAAKTVRQIERDAQNESAPMERQASSLLAWWTADFIVLTDAAWLVVLAALAACCRRLPYIRDRRPLSEAAASGIWAAVLLPITHAVFDTYTLPERYAAAIILLGSAVLGVIVYRRNDEAGRQRLRRNAARFAGGFCTIFLIRGTLGVFVRHQSEGMVDFYMTISAASGTADTLSSALLFGAPQCLPFAMVIISAVAAWIRHVPASAAIVDSFQRFSIPFACTLLILFGGLTLGTLRQERTVDAAVQRMVQHEGMYDASQAGIPWPGPPKP